MATGSYQFTPTPAGTRWYHTHTMSMDDLHRGSYTGQFGFLVIEGGPNPGQLRSGALPGAARLGALFQQYANGHTTIWMPPGRSRKNRR